jgi:hypothetical protein
VGRASALLDRVGARRGLAFAALAAVLAAYYAWPESLPDLTMWWEIAFLSLVVVPAVFALVYVVLPLWRARGLFPVGLAFGLLAVVLTLAGLDALANFAKLAGVTLVAFWFLSYFETAAWVVLVAAIVPVVDAISVWRGPTHHIVTEKPEIFTTFSFAFPIPGEHNSMNLGLPDLLFFALFLAACARFGLRAEWTWLAMVLSFGATLTIAVASDVNGLPALPLLCLGFFAPNVDLLWQKLRPARQSHRRPRTIPRRSTGR